MGCPTIKKAFEDALKKSDINNTDGFLVYDNGTIYEVTFGDMVTELGVTGSLTAENGGNATPVLTGTAPNYIIRGIKGGDGAVVQENTNGSLTVSAKLGNAGGSAAGEQILKNITGDTLFFKRLKAGGGIELDVETDSITINNTQAIGDSQTVIVSELADFPTAQSGVIQLADNTKYQIVNSISTANRFVLGDNTIVGGSDFFGPTLTYTGVDSMFTFEDGDQEISNISLSCPNGTLFNCSNGTNGLLLARWLNVTEVKNLGNIDKSFTVLVFSVFGLVTGTGFTYSNISDRILSVQNVNVGAATNPLFNFFDLGTATFRGFGLTLLSFRSTLAGQSFLKGAASGANINAGVIGYLERITIDGDMSMLDTIDNGDPGWDFMNCNKLADTDPHCLISLTAASTTTISAVNTPVQVNGTFSESLSQVFESTAAGAVRYKGRRTKFSRVDITCSFEPAAGTNKDLELSIAINGVVENSTKIPRNADSGDAAVTSIDWGFNLNTDDEVTVFVANLSDTTNVVVNSLLLRVA